MLALGHLYGHQFMNLALFFYEFRILLFADLTKKLIEVIICESFDLVFFDFRLVPFLKTAEMNQGTRSRTFARTTQKFTVFLSLFKHTVLAFSRYFSRTDRYLLVTIDNSIDQH
jgi:hypothetical protein